MEQDSEWQCFISIKWFLLVAASLWHWRQKYVTAQYPMDKTVLPAGAVTVALDTECRGHEWFATTPNKYHHPASNTVCPHWCYCSRGNPDREIRGNMCCLFMAVGIKSKVPFSREVTPSLSICLGPVFPQRNPKVNLHIICQRQRTANSAVMCASYSSHLMLCVQDLGQF